ncbi:MAG: DUF2220 domain-containing protein [Gammaproteobacteria bacterium]|nr:DUF2220 domain-containing protein [Gammaproteobacteria bacterium]
MPDASGSDQQNTPPWLQEQPGIEALLHSVLNRLDKNPATIPGFTLNKKRLPELFNQGEAADICWSCLQTLLQEKNPLSPAVFSFRPNKKRNYLDPEYSNARIRFLPEAEQQLRYWLKRPVKASELELWRTTVQQHSSQFPGDVSRLSAKNIAVDGKSNADIINGFMAISQYLDQQLTLRSLSARCFWQDSKFLDSKEDIVQLLYPELKIKPRPVLVSVYLPDNIQGILFIENQDSYTQAITGSPKASVGYALVYCAGFKLSAERIRRTEGVSLHFCGANHQQMQNQFSLWWFEEAENNWPVYFWGDLDYSGMDILASLKRRFETIQAWQPGYQPMLELIRNEQGHAPQTTGKQEQKDPQKTGCEYADMVLLPALREIGYFVDQEWAI